MIKFLRGFNSKFLLKSLKGVGAVVVCNSFVSCANKKEKGKVQAAINNSFTSRWEMVNFFVKERNFDQEKAIELAEKCFFDLYKDDKSALLEKNLSELLSSDSEIERMVEAIMAKMNCERKIAEEEVAECFLVLYKDNFEILERFFNTHYKSCGVGFSGNFSILSRIDHRIQTMYDTFSEQDEMCQALTSKGVPKSIALNFVRSKFEYLKNTKYAFDFVKLEENDDVDTICDKIEDVFCNSFSTRGEMIRGLMENGIEEDDAVNITFSDNFFANNRFYKNAFWGISLDQEEMTNRIENTFTNKWDIIYALKERGFSQQRIDKAFKAPGGREFFFKSNKNSFLKESSEILEDTISHLEENYCKTDKGWQLYERSERGDNFFAFLDDCSCDCDSDCSSSTNEDSEDNTMSSDGDIY